MEHLEGLTLEVFNNRESYSTQDYLVIMNVLKEYYHRLNGDIPTETCCVCEVKELDYSDHSEDDISYSNYYADDSEGYLSDYIESY